ncbi:MAG: geranylgeranyl reductase family protein [Halocynthiibacter sp.]|jgi:geranylgeranyl reductase family protein
MHRFGLVEVLKVAARGWIFPGFLGPDLKSCPMSEPVSEQPINFDLIVMGSGPAGGAAAYTARKLGLRVALIDKKAFPRDKLCGGLFSGRSLRYFTQIFDEAPSPELLGRTRDVEFFLRGQSLGRLRDVPPLYMTMRWDLDGDIHSRALNAGAVDFSGESAREIDLTARKITLRDGRVLAYKALIGADGVNSQVARTLFGKAFDHDKIGFALEVEGPVSPEDTPIRIDFSAAAWGYGWSFPKKASTTIGVGGVHSANPDMKGHMAKYMALLGQEGDPKSFKGHFIPFGDFRKHPGQGAVLLCGDAAGLVDPITGEGIAFALKSGQLAAQSVAQALAEGAPASAYDRYKSSLKEIHRAMVFSRLLRPIICLPRFEKAFAKAFSNSTTLRRQYMEVLAGEIEYQQMIWPVLRRLPGLLGRALLAPFGRSDKAS